MGLYVRLTRSSLILWAECTPNVPGHWVMFPEVWLRLIWEMLDLQKLLWDVNWSTVSGVTQIYYGSALLSWTIVLIQVYWVGLKRILDHCRGCWAMRGRLILPPPASQVQLSGLQKLSSCFLSEDCLSWPVTESLFPNYRPSFWNGVQKGLVLKLPKRILESRSFMVLFQFKNETSCVSNRLWSLTSCPFVLWLDFSGCTVLWALTVFSCVWSSVCPAWEVVSGNIAVLLLHSYSRGASLDCLSLIGLFIATKLIGPDYLWIVYPCVNFWIVANFNKTGGGGEMEQHTIAWLPKVVFYLFSSSAVSCFTVSLDLLLF